MARRLGGCLLLLLSIRSAAAQDVPLAEPTPAADPDARPGLWRMGPFYVTPKVQIGALGIDTNVFYTPTERQTDFTGSGGPGLEIVLPLGPLRLSLDGLVNYIYFARTESQRRLGGLAAGRVKWSRGRVEAEIDETFARTFSRPSFEVDERVDQDAWATIGTLDVRITGGLDFKANAHRIQNEVAPGQPYQGVDLGTALSRDERRLVLELEQRLTPKSSLIAGGDQQLDRYPLDPSRDVDSNRAYAGFAVDSLTRLSGRAVGGVRFFRPKDPARGPDFSEPYADAALAYRFGPRTRLVGSYRRDLTGSIYDSSAGLPALRNEILEARLLKGLPGRFDVELFGVFTRTSTREAVSSDTQPEGAQAAVREDDILQGGADLGYRFGGHYRFGVSLTYTDRNSNFEDFGIEGLLAGLTLKYLP